MSAEIRRAGSGDAAVLSALGGRLFAQTFAGDNTPEDMHAYLASAFSPERQAAELADPRRTTWIAEEDGDAVGYAAIVQGSVAAGVTAERPVELQRIYVDAHHHGSGLGRRLLELAVEAALACGADVLWLGVWERNPRAIAFYEKSGFETVGLQTFRLGADVQHDHVMALRLG